MKIHHTAVCTRDMDTSLRFWQDGLGFVQKMDASFDGDWPTLFGRASKDCGPSFWAIRTSRGRGSSSWWSFPAGWPTPPAPPSEPAIGFFLVSVYLQIEPALARLASLSLGGTPARISLEGGVQMAVVHDPNGLTVELIDRGEG